MAVFRLPGMMKSTLYVISSSPRPGSICGKATTTVVVIRAKINHLSHDRGDDNNNGIAIFMLRRQRGEEST